MIAPLAFAQTRTTKTRQTTTTQPAITPATTQMTTGAVAVGTVTAFTPGKTTVTPSSPIVVQSSPDAKPMSYVLGRKVRYVSKDGKAIVVVRCIEQNANGKQIIDFIQTFADEPGMNPGSLSRAKQ